MSREVIRSMEIALKDAGLDLLLAYFDGTHSILHPNYIHYITGYNPIVEAMFALVPGKKAQLILTGSWEKGLVESPAQYDVVVVSDLIAAVESLISTNELQRVMVAGHENLRTDLMEALGALTSKLVLDNRIVDELALASAPESVAYFERSASIAQAGYMAMLNGVSEGKAEYVLAAEVDQAMYSQGAEDNFGMISGSEHNYAIHPPTDRQYRAGDIILAEISPGYRGCYTQICRTVVLGKPIKEVRNNYNLLIKSFENSLKEIVPGEPLSKACRAMNQVFIDAGYEKYCNPPYMRVRGHSFNFGCAVPGNITVDNHTVLQEGMILVLHPNQYFPDTGYLMFGESIRVGVRGPELLIKGDWGLRGV